MPAIILRDRCSQRPTGPVEIDWTNPLAKGLRYFVLLDAVNYRTNLVNQQQIAAAMDSGIWGSGTSITTEQNDGYQGEFSIRKPDWIGSYAVSYRPILGVVCWMFSSANTWDGLYAANPSDIFLTSNSGFAGQLTPTGNSTGGFLRVCASVPAANNFRAISGVGDVAIDTSAPLPIGAMTKFVIGGDYEQRNWCAAEFAYFAVWDAPLADDEMRAFNAQPYSVLRRKARILYFPSAGGGATALTVQGITQVHSLGSPALTQHNALSPSAVAQLQALGQPTLTEHNLLVANAISQAQSLGAPSLTQHNLLAVDALGQAHVLGVPTLTQAHVLVVQGATQAQTLESPSLTQHNALTPDAMTQAQTLANVALTVAGSIVAADIAQGHSLGSPSLTQHHALEVAAMMQAHSLGNVDMTQAGTLSVQGLTQAQTIEAAALIQHHALVVQAILQTHSLGNVTLTASDALAVAGITQAQLLDAPALTQHNVLVVQGVTQAQILQLCTLGGLVIGSLAGTIVAYALIDGELVAYAALDGTVETVH